VTGSERGYLSSLRATWLWSRAAALWLALGLAPLLFFQTTVHEGSHCLAMAIEGEGCRILAPFPQALALGYVHGLTIGGNDAEIPPIAVIVAPQLVAVLLILLLRAGARRTRDERWALLNRLWLLGACLDLLNNTFWRPSGGFGDWSAMASEAGLGPGLRFAVSLPMWLVALGGLFVPIRSEFAPPPASARDLSEIGLVYALLSGSAVIVSLAVRVPGSDRGSLWYRVPILLQTASALVCLALYAASRRAARGSA